MMTTAHILRRLAATSLEWTTDDPFVVSTSRHGGSLERTRVTATTAGLEVLVHRGPERLRLSLYADDVLQTWLDLEFATFEFEGGHDGRKLPWASLGTWCLHDELGRAGAGDAFDEFLGAVVAAWQRAFWPRSASLDELLRGGPTDDRCALWCRAVAGVLAPELRGLRASIDPMLLAFVGRFRRRWRFRALRWLRLDPTGRVRQLAQSEPGAFLLGLLLDRRRKDWGRAYFEDVEAGVRVNELILSGLTKVAPAGTRLPVLRLLARRSGPRVDPEWLTVQPLHFVPEDIPAEAEANERWHAVMRSGLAATPAGAAAAAEWLRRGYFDFWSRHACGPMPPQLPPDHLWDFISGAGRPIDRHTSVRRLVAEEQAWMEALWRAGPEEERDGCPIDGGGGYPDGYPDEEELESEPFSMAFPPERSPSEEEPSPVLPAWSGPEGTVEPLTTRRRLFEEGLRMRHCVARYAGELLAGALSLFHLEAGGEMATLSLSGSDVRSLSLHDFRGIGNTAPPEPVRRLARAWLEARGVDPRPLLEKPPSDDAFD